MEAPKSSNWLWDKTKSVASKAKDHTLNVTDAAKGTVAGAVSVSTGVVGGVIAASTDAMTSILVSSDDPLERAIVKRRYILQAPYIARLGFVAWSAGLVFLASPGIWTRLIRTTLFTSCGTVILVPELLKKLTN